MCSINVRQISLATLVSVSMLFVSIGPVEGADSTSAVLTTPRQTIELEGPGTAQFGARGEGRLRGDSGPFHGEAVLRTEVHSYVFRFTKARIIEDAGGQPIGLALTGRGQVARDRGREPFAFTATVQRDASSDCLIYDIVGPNVHLRFEAEGMILFSE
jgi:hypothetical protein